MLIRKICWIGLTAFSVMLGLSASAAFAQEVKGIVKTYDEIHRLLTLEQPGLHKDIVVHLTENVSVKGLENEPLPLSELQKGDRVKLSNAVMISSISVEPKPPERTVLAEFWHNFTHNLFKPLLLFFYMGFLVPILKVQFEFPYVIYQGLTIYLLIAIGWHGGEELSSLDPGQISGVLGFMGVGLITNFAIGVLAYVLLSLMTKMRRVDKATVAGYYGSDSAGTFATCLGVLATVGIAFDPYMPVMLAVMEVPGCLVALYLVSRLRAQGMDPSGSMPDEPGYDPKARAPLPTADAARPRSDDRRGRGG